MWLLKKLKPDFKTIANFRKDNRKSFKKVFRQFNFICRDLGLFGGELLAVDGSKFKAVNSSQKNFTKAKLKRVLKEIDEKIETYLNKIDAADHEEAKTQKPTAEELMMKFLQLKERQERYQQLSEQMQTNGDSQISLTDPDSRSMPKSLKVPVGYNVQFAVDAKHKLIAEQDVTNSTNDLSQLSNTALKAKKTLGVNNLKVVADKGYYHGKEVKKCEKAGIEVFISKPLTSANTKQGLFGKERFKYDSKKDCYICPAGKQLRYQFDSYELGRHIRYYTSSECKNCKIKAKCTRNKDNRRTTRWVDEDIPERMEQRVADNPDVMKERKKIVEHPFGTIKHWNDQGYFLMKGLEKIRAEMSLTSLAYNIKRVINILGMSKVIESFS
jgi:hypothetical protein